MGMQLSLMRCLLWGGYCDKTCLIIISSNSLRYVSSSLFYRWGKRPREVKSFRDDPELGCTPRSVCKAVLLISTSCRAWLQIPCTVASLQPLSHVSYLSSLLLLTFFSLNNSNFTFKKWHHLYWLRYQSFSSLLSPWLSGLELSFLKVSYKTCCY